MAARQPLAEQVNFARPFANVRWLCLAPGNGFMCQSQVRLPSAEKERTLIKHAAEIFPAPSELLALKALLVGATVRPRRDKRANDA